MRPRVSIIIPAWNEWALTRACLASLRPTLGVRDEVIVVDNGSQDGTAAGLLRHGWVRTVSHAENLGFAAGCNSGAAVATGEVVVFLNNDTLVTSRWLDGLLAPFADPSVGATGPRSNFVSGAQLVASVPYSADRTADLQRFARSWRQEHRGQTTEVARLVGFCLAVRRDVLTAIGGLDEGFGLGGAEDDDLCLRLVDAGHRLLIAHESFVHHHGRRTFEGNGVDRHSLQEQDLQRLSGKRRRSSGGPAQPLLSACLIVKDEADNLPGCLAALEGFADEVVVYDTGSTDGTVEVARAAGATVVEGYWDDDFGRARNAALAHCRGQWVLHVDADEIVDGPLERVRDELASTVAETLAVQIHNVDDAGDIGLSHTGVRLFRRGRAHWHGALHEQVVSVDDRPVRLAPSSLSILHSGYTHAAMESKDKRERNLRVARAAVERSGAAEPLAAINLGRSLRSAGQSEAALAQFEQVLSTDAPRAVLRQARRFGAETLMELGRSREALEWVEELRAHTSSRSMPDYLAGTAHLNLLDPEAALTYLTGLVSVGDEDLAVPDRLVQERRGLALVAARRWSEGAAELRASVAAADAEEGPWAELVEAQWRAGEPLADLAALLRDDPRAQVQVLGRVANATPAAADAFAEVLWGTACSRTAVLALAAHLGGRLDLDRSLEWSVRMRTEDAPARCPVAALSRSEHRPALERLRACAVLTTAFQDDRGQTSLPTVATAIGVADFGQALQDLDQLAPCLLPRFVLAAATTPGRAAAMAAVLQQLGAADAARDLLGQPA